MKTPGMKSCNKKNKHWKPITYRATKRTMNSGRSFLLCWNLYLKFIATCNMWVTQHLLAISASGMLGIIKIGMPQDSPPSDTDLKQEKFQLEAFGFWQMARKTTRHRMNFWSQEFHSSFLEHFHHVVLSSHYAIILELIGNLFLATRNLSYKTHPIRLIVYDHVLCQLASSFATSCVGAK